MYEYYKIARNKAWEILLECNVKELPIDLEAIADIYQIRIMLFFRSNITRFFKKDVLCGDGFIINNQSKKEIFINDTIKNRNRRRFTLAHELGHALLNHNLDSIHYRNSEIDHYTNIQETQANIFARDLLMPATVLAALHIQTPEEIMKLCDISYQSAKIRADRLQQLYKRAMFNKHPLEHKVYEQFKDFINFHKNNK